MTPHSHLLLDRACRLADSPALPAGAAGVQVAVVGGVGRGIAGPGADLQLAFWAAELPDADDCQRWLHDVEAKDVSATERHITFRWEDTWVETAWRTYAETSDLIDRLLDAAVENHAELALANEMLAAVPLYMGGYLIGWQERLREYPAPLAARLIDGCLRDVWSLPHAVDARFSPVPPGGRLRHADRLAGDLQNVLRILFALNRRWEPDWRWLEDELPRLEAAPLELGDRVDAIVAERDTITAARALVMLADDTLALFGEYPGVAAARATLAQGLTAHP